MITPTAWSSGPVTVTDTAMLHKWPLTWQLLDDSLTEVAAGGLDSVGDSSTRVVFTPTAGLPVGIYTVRILGVDAGPGDDSVLAELVDAFAVITATPLDLPDGITLTWLDGWGAIRFTAVGMTSTQTVKLIGPGGVLVPIRGYETPDWHDGAGWGYSFEHPLGVAVRAGICEATDIVWQGGDDATITTPAGRAWLRDLHDPLLSMEVQVASTGDEERVARQTVHRIVGRPRPIVRWDVRSSRSGTITLRVDNGTVAGWVSTFRRRLDLLLESGRPLLLSIDQAYGFEPCYLSVGSYRMSRLGKRPRWACELNYEEVDNPTGAAVVPAEVTYGQAAQIPPGATYADWAATTYLGVATRTSV